MNIQRQNVLLINTVIMTILTLTIANIVQAEITI